MLDIDWEDERSFSFTNPKILDRDKQIVKQAQSQLSSHIFLTTSGSCSLKVVALSKKAFLTSAKSVNDLLHASLRDIWINPLPHFHVGGLSIYARAFLARNYVYRFDHKWNPLKWVDYVTEKRGTLTSLVSTQLWDLLESGVTPPKSLRAIFIGGQKLSLSLYERALENNWPILPTFGMTEACSQVATAKWGSPELMLLPHIQAKIGLKGTLSLKSDALLTGYFTPDFIDPKRDRWFETEDLVDLKGDLLIPKGRIDEVLKIKGELINLNDLEEKLESLKRRFNLSCETALIPVEDLRSGYKLHLYHTPANLVELIDAFNESVIPEARLKVVQELTSLPKTAIGKIAKKELAGM